MNDLNKTKIQKNKQQKQNNLKNDLQKKTNISELNKVPEWVNIVKSDCYIGVR